VVQVVAQVVVALVEWVVAMADVTGKAPCQVVAAVAMVTVVAMVVDEIAVATVTVVVSAAVVPAVAMAIAVTTLASAVQWVRVAPVDLTGVQMRPAAKVALARAPQTAAGKS